MEKVHQGRPFNQIFMGQRIFIFILTIFYGAICLAQSSSKDIQQELIEKAKKGDAKAQYNLGYRYHTGYDRSPNVETAIFWYRKAAEQGNTEAMLSLFAIYHNRHEYNQAALWLEKLRNCHFNWKKANPEIINILPIYGAYYASGRENIEKNIPYALSWFKIASDLGNSDASEWLGFMYENESYGMTDYQQALKWYKKALEQGSENDFLIYNLERKIAAGNNVSNTQATIDWLSSQNSVSQQTFQIKAGIKSNTKVENIEVLVNGQSQRGINAVNNDGYDMTVNQQVTLSPGQNIVRINVTNAAGTATREEYITYNSQAPTPTPTPTPAPIFNDDYAKRLALIIGNSNYVGQALKNPKNDATDVANKLRDLGFDVMLTTDASHERMDKDIETFGTRAENYDVALFYYAGHGIQSKGRNYLLPVDAELQSEEQLRYRCTPTDYVLDKLDRSGCKMKIVILDACRNNPFERSWHRGGGTRGLSMMNAPIGTLIAYATALGDVANDGEGRNSPYTEALLEVLDMPGVNLSRFFDEVTERVMQATNEMQAPWISKSTRGTFYFNKNKQ